MTFLPAPLVGILTVMSMFAANSHRIGWNQLPVSLGMGIIVGLIFGVLFSLHKFTSKASALIASIFTLCFMLWYILTPWVGLVILIITLALGIKFNVKLEKVTKPLTLMLILAVVVSIGMAMVSTPWGEKTEASPIAETGTKLPNVYFIIPDRMPSIDAMTESGIDSTEFVEYMRSLGFYIKENQMSYDEFNPFYTTKVSATRTMRFLSAVLNMDAEIGLHTPYKQIFDMIRNPAIISELHELGYEYNHVGSWFTETSYCPIADVNYIYEGATFLEVIMRQEFTQDVFDRTMLKGLNIGVWWVNVIGEVSRERLLYQTESILEVADKDNQHFVFAHLILPHEPFAFTAIGDIQDDETLTTPELYYEQIKYAMVYLRGLTDDILRRDPTAIIIIQSDEGMAYHKPVTLNAFLTLTQWNGVLTAWRIPGADESELEQLKHTEILEYLVEWLGNGYKGSR